MSQLHKYSMSEIENMLPYELTIYIDMTLNHAKKSRS